MLFTVLGSSAPIEKPTLVDLLMQQLLNQLLAVAIELTGKGQGARKVVPSTIALLMKPPLRLLAEAVKGLIKGSCNHKRLLSKQFAYNWNHRYIQISSLKEGRGS